MPITPSGSREKDPLKNFPHDADNSCGHARLWCAKDLTPITLIGYHMDEERIRVAPHTAGMDASSVGVVLGVARNINGECA